MYSHNVENFMELATNHLGEAAKESRSDQYYRTVYKNIESGKIISWNWSAMFLGPGWCIYRKMYMTSLVYTILWFLFVVIICLNVDNNAPLSGWHKKVLSVAVLYMFIPLYLFFGIFGNWLYVKHIHKKIDKGYHLCLLDNTDHISFWLYILMGILTPILVIVSACLVSMGDRRNVKETMTSL